MKQSKIILTVNTKSLFKFERPSNHGDETTDPTTTTATTSITTLTASTKTCVF